jgi:hypothetical protein
MKRNTHNLFIFTALLLMLGIAAFGSPIPRKMVLLHTCTNANARVLFGVEKLSKILLANGYKVVLNPSTPISNIFLECFIGENADAFITTQLKKQSTISINQKKEGFIIVSNELSLVIAGSDVSGVLYGCMELADRIQQQKKIPLNIAITDAPEMVLRGTCIGLQKSTYLLGRDVYEYPLTPKTFPWFYNKQLWIKVLDSMVENRFNSLYLWNGHPFASLVRLKEYPYAVEVDSATFKKNENIYRFITEEADKRGIWVIQMFYNILVSAPFADYHHIKTQDRNRPIIPLIADYTRKSIAAFVEKYPNVGLMVALGEAMEGIGNDDIVWFTKTIIPGVKDGLKALGKTTEPPIVLRAHDTDAPAVIKAAKSLYSNLYTEAKFNGEALTTYEPRGAWADLHRTLSRLGSVQIENVHIMANLEPFRYAAADFIQKSVLSMHNIYEANGLHLYPQASYWDWPYSADKTSPRLLQIERDWLWYKQWSRYAWNAHRDSAKEFNYWGGLLGNKFGCGLVQGKNIQDAYNQAGEIAPKLLRRFGITDGNRQTLTLGMLMTQLINPYRFGLFDLMYDCESPEGEKLIEYAEKDWKHEPHIGETPIQIMQEVVLHASKAVAAIEKATPFVTTEKTAFNQTKNDIYCYQALANHYAQKAAAALLVLRYKYSNNITDLEKAVPLLEQSMVSYKNLVELTKDTYLYANSMQTKQRKIPMRGIDATFITWQEMLVPFSQELLHFKTAIDSIKSNKKNTGIEWALTNASVVLVDKKLADPLQKNARLFIDSNFVVTEIANELVGLRGLPFDFSEQKISGTTIAFSATIPIKMVVGFFNKKDNNLLKAPELETDASANNYGQSETVIANALLVKGLGLVNIHTYSFAAGANSLKLPKGACLVLGFVPQNQTIKTYDAGFSETGLKKEIDWLFE